MNILDVINKPFGWVLLQLYLLLHSYGIALIIFTLITKIVVLPLQIKSKKGMLDMQRIQPKLKELEKKYKNDKEKYSMEVQKAYKEENVSMFGGCLPVIIMMIIMIALYYDVRQPLTYMFNISVDAMTKIANIPGVKQIILQSLPAAQQTAEGFANAMKAVKNYEIPIANAIGSNLAAAQQIAPNVKAIDFNFFGLNLAQMPNFKVLNGLWTIPILSGVTAFGYSWLAKKYQPAAAQNAQANSMNNTMTYIMPFFSIYIAFVVPAGLGLYWIASNVFMMIQEPILNWYCTRNKTNGEITSKEAKS